MILHPMSVVLAPSISHEFLSCFRYGDGYTVILRVTGVMPDLEPVKTFMETTFLECVLKVSRPSMLENI